jgi:hypothetical protein
MYLPHKDTSYRGCGYTWGVLKHWDYIRKGVSPMASRSVTRHDNQQGGREANDLTTLFSHNPNPWRALFSQKKEKSSSWMKSRSLSSTFKKEGGLVIRKNISTLVSRMNQNMPHQPVRFAFAALLLLLFIIIYYYYYYYFGVLWSVL